ncbi:MAG: TolC family protein [Gemmatimonadales bacterium]
MFRLVWLAALIAAGGAPHPVAAQQTPLDERGLVEFVRGVLARNRAVQATGLDVSAAADRIAPAGALPDPMVRVGVMSLPVPGFAAEPMTQLPLMVEQRFPGFGKRGAATAMARADSGAAAAELGVVVTGLAAEAAETWFELAYARRALEVWSGRAGLAERAVLAAQARYETGAAPQTDLLRARLRRAEVADEERGLRAAVLAAAARADALRGGGDDSIVTALAQPADAPAAETLPADRLDEGNAHLMLVRAELDRARRHADALAIAARPDFTVSVQNGVRFGGREPFVTALVGLSVPLWSGRKQRPLARAASLEVDATRARYDDLRARLDGQVRGQLAELDGLGDRIRLAADQIVPLADAASASALQRYQVGAVEFSAVLDTQDDAFRARLSLARLIADYGAARVRLAALVGEEWYR